eukprot:1056101_1
MSLITDNIYVTDVGTVALKDMDDDDSGMSHFIFTTNTNSNEDEYCFPDTHSFNLPMVADDMNHRIAVYARPKNGSFPLKLIKKIHIKFKWIKYNTWIMKYKWKRYKPLNIIKSMNIYPLNERYGERGRVHIYCHSEITIHKTIQINANQCGMTKQMSLFYDVENNIDGLKYGAFVGGGDGGRGRGGGIIELISQSNIVNNGTLTSNGSCEHFVGGTISIKTAKCFINNGQIFAEPNGQIIIKCA